MALLDPRAWRGSCRWPARVELRRARLVPRDVGHAPRRAGSVPDCQRSWREYYGQPACIIECHPNAIPRAAERRAADGCPVGPSVLQATPAMQPWRINMGMQPGIKSFATKFGITVDIFELSGRYFALVASLAPQAPSGNIFCP